MIITAAIMAGGQSARMGTDKLTLEIDGTTWLAHAAKAALDANLPTVVIGCEQPEDWPLSSVEFILDAQPGQGPLGGLITALRTTNTTVLALAADMPQLSTPAIQWICAEAQKQALVDGLITVNGEQLEPLFAIYAPGCLPLAEQRLTQGRRSLHGLIENGSFHKVTIPDWIAGQLVNINTQEERTAWEQAQNSR